MDILLQNKQQVETYFGKQALFAISVLDMIADGEKAYAFPTGGIGTGFDITVGFFNDKARYAGFHKKGTGNFSEADLRAVLSMFGPYSNWKTATGSEYFDYEEKNGDTIVATATGWYSAKHGVAFVYVPHTPGQIVIVPDRTAVEAKLENS